MNINSQNLIPFSNTESFPDTDIGTGNGQTESVNAVKHIPEPETGTKLQETHRLEERSLAKIVAISAEEMKRLILQGEYSDNVHYQVEGTLKLDCNWKTDLPRSLYAETIKFKRCPNLAKLHEGISAKNFHFYECSKLTDLYKGLSAESIEFISCRGLTKLSNGITARNIRFFFCLNLRELPDDLSVWTLFVQDCPEFTHLPRRLSVGKFLGITDSGLTALPDDPEDLKVGDDLYFSGCGNLTSMPNWITEMGLTSDGDERRVYIDRTGLSDTIIENLQGNQVEGMQFIVSHPAGKPEVEFSSLNEAFDFWRELASSGADVPELGLPPHQEHTLKIFLGRLTGTADYKNQVSRPLLAKRVMEELLPLLTGDDSIQKRALYRIHDGLSSCDDRVISTMDDLETMQFVIRAETLAVEKNVAIEELEAELKAMARQLMIRDQIRKITDAHKQTLQFVDEVEIRLAFRIGLSEYFTFPGSTKNMIFRNSAYVEKDDIARAVSEIEISCSDAAVEVFIKHWSPWQRYENARKELPFNQLKVKVVDHIGDCPIRLEKTDKMVEANGHQLDYDYLVRTLRDSGLHPTTRTPVDWSMVVRLVEKTPS